MISVARLLAEGGRSPPTSTRPTSSCTTHRPATPRTRSPCPGWPTRSLARTPIGIFRDVDRPVYDDLMAGQLDKAAQTQGAGDADALAGLIAGSDTWTVD